MTYQLSKLTCPDLPGWDIYKGQLINEWLAKSNKDTPSQYWVDLWCMLEENLIAHRTAHREATLQYQDPEQKALERQRICNWTRRWRELWNRLITYSTVRPHAPPTYDWDDEAWSAAMNRYHHLDDENRTVGHTLPPPPPAPPARHDRTAELRAAMASMDLFKDCEQRSNTSPDPLMMDGPGDGPSDDWLYL